MSNTFISKISGKSYPLSQKISAENIQPAILLLIQKEYPEFDKNDFISISELNYYREKYIDNTLIKQFGEMTSLEKKVLDVIRKHETLSDKLEEENLGTFGERVADKVAAFGGSWTFIISFTGFLLLWIFINVLALHNKGFDPYPFILLNLMLSCLAALQAPVIMMSQNRQESKDRERAKQDYMINLKSELEVRMLHEKLDHLLINQEQKLLQIQQIQIEMMNDVLRQIENISSSKKHK